MSGSPYGYIPTSGTCWLFLVLFFATTALHILQAMYYRLWWLFPTLVLGGCGEVIGWIARTWSSADASNPISFAIQICCIIISPSLVTAAIFIAFRKIVNVVGTEYSRLSPTAYSVTFIGANLAALIVQSVGCAKAVSAKTKKGSNTGTNIVVAGLIVQMVVITCYCIIQTEFLWRVSFEKPSGPQLHTVPSTSIEDLGSSKASDLQPQQTGLDRLTKPIRRLLMGLCLALVFIYVRSIYRTIELLGGWGSPISLNQKLFST